MNDDMIALSRRAVACKGWRWMRGMNTTTGDTFIAFADADEAYWLAHPDDPCEVDPIAGLLPDLTDPATLGCLLSLVREAWRDHIVAKFGNGWWELETDGARWDDATTQSFVEALVAALESAP